MKYKFGKEISSNFVKEKLNWNSKYYIKLGKKYAKISSLKQKKCYICSSEKSHKVSTFFGLNYVMCDKCNHVYMNRRLSDKDLTKYYTEDPNYFNNPYTRKNIIKLRDTIFKPKIEFIKKLTNGKKWLDVGAGDGAAVFAAKSSKFDVTGIEISETARMFAKKHRNLNLFNGTLNDFLEQNTAKWDVVSFFGVMEHVPNPVQVLRQSNKLLKKKGLVAIEVPNYESFSTYFQKLTKSPDRHLSIPAHIMLFTKKSAEHILRKNGFEPIAIWYYGMDAIELLKYMKRLDKEFFNSELLQALSTKINEIQNIFDSSEKSDTFLIIGKKISDVKLE